MGLPGVKRTKDILGFSRKVLVLAVEPKANLKKPEKPCVSSRNLSLESTLESDLSSRSCFDHLRQAHTLLGPSETNK